ncbi:hypothetical protein Bca101_075100 [Brassica carinata]
MPLIGQLAMTKEMRCKFVRTQRRGLIERQYGLCLDRDASSSSIQMVYSLDWTPEMNQIVSASQQDTLS